MQNIFKKLTGKTGLPPGTLSYIGEEKQEPVTMTIMDYDEDRCDERQCDSIAECAKYKDTASKTWIIVNGIHNTEVIQKIGEDFGIHPLTMEDVMNTSHLPKIEDLPGYLFTVLRLPYWDSEKDTLSTEQISILSMENIVITFLENERGLFDPLKRRIADQKGRFRKRNQDYLTYAIIDFVVDNYFQVLDKVSDKLAEIEAEILDNPDQSIMQEINRLQQTVMTVKSHIKPFKDIAEQFVNEEISLIREDTLIYYRDVFDHTIHVISTLEQYREMLNGMVNTYLSIASNRMNDVMKVLTIIATVFIPLTFIAGLYGMNFQYIPELQWKYGYFAVWGVMILVAGAMFLYFKKKRWM